MKKFYLLLLVPLLVMMSSCHGDEGPRKGAIWDIPFPSVGYVIFDSEGNNILKADPEAIYDIEVEYKGKTYRYEEVTRMLLKRSFGLHAHWCYPYMLCIGDFDQNESGSYIVRFRDYEWLVEYEYELRWKHYEPVKYELVKINGEVVERCVVDEWDAYNDGDLRDVYARPLYYIPTEREYDISYPKATFVIIDEKGNNFFKKYPEKRQEVVIEYNGETYRYNEAVTRELLREPLELYTPALCPHCIEFGDFGHTDKGSYVIKYGLQEWNIDFEYKKRWENGMPIAKGYYQVDGEYVEPIKIDEVLVEGRWVDFYALPLELEVAAWDIAYPSVSYVVLDDEGNNIFSSEPESMLEFEILYNDVTYKYNNESRALPPEPLAITTDLMYPYRLTFGDFDYNDRGSYVIKFRDKEWRVVFEYKFEWVAAEPVMSATLKIDGEEANPEFIEKWHVDDYHGDVDMYAIALR